MLLLDEKGELAETWSMLKLASHTTGVAHYHGETFLKLLGRKILHISTKSAEFGNSPLKTAHTYFYPTSTI